MRPESKTGSNGSTVVPTTIVINSGCRISSGMLSLGYGRRRLPICLRIQKWCRKQSLCVETMMLLLARALLDLHLLLKVLEQPPVWNQYSSTGGGNRSDRTTTTSHQICGVVSYLGYRALHLLSIVWSLDLLMYRQTVSPRSHKGSCWSSAAIDGYLSKTLRFPNRSISSEIRESIRSRGVEGGTMRLAQFKNWTVCPYTLV